MAFGVPASIDIKKVISQFSQPPAAGSPVKPITPIAPTVPAPAATSSPNAITPTPAPAGWSPALTNPNAGHPTGNLGAGSSTAAETAGNATQVAQNTAMNTASTTASNVTQTPQNTVPAPIPDPAKAIKEAQDKAAADAVTATKKAAADKDAADKKAASDKIAADKKIADEKALADKKKSDDEAKLKLDAADTKTASDLESLREIAFKAATTTEDPVFKAAFNTAIQQIGMRNNAATDQLKMQIASDPNLRGQGAGTAALAALARDQGFSVDQLMGQMSMASAQRIADLNKWGFDKAEHITEYRQTLTDSKRREMIQSQDKNLSSLLSAGDFEGYAKAYQNAYGTPIDISSLKAMSPAAIAQRDAQLRAGDYAGYAKSLKDAFGVDVDVSKLQATSPEKIAAMNALLAAEDYEGYAKAFKAAYGVDIDTSKLKATGDATKAAMEAQKAAGDYDGYAKAFEEAYGIPIDVTALKSMSPATTQAVDTLAAAMNRKINEGDTVGAKAIFEQIKAMAPALYGNLTFEDAISGKEVYLAKSKAREAVMSTVRTQISQGDITSAWSGIQQAYTKEERTAGGNSLITSKSVEDINKALTDAGLQPITSKADLIGRADDVFTANEISKAKANLNGSQGIAAVTNDLMDTLKSAGYNITDPAAITAIKSFVLDQQLNSGITFDASGEPHFDTSKLIPPWDAKSKDAYLFSDWPVMGADGKVSGGFDPYSDTNPQPTPDSELGKYQDGLDQKWVEYISTNKKDALTREQWFYATKGGTQAPDKMAPGVNLDTTPAFDVNDPLAFDKIIQQVRLNKEPLSEDQKTFLKASGKVPEISTSKLADEFGGSIDKANAGINGPNNGLAFIDGSIVKILQDAGTFIDNRYTSSPGFFDGSPFSTEEARSQNWVSVEYNGTKYKVDNLGRWFRGTAEMKNAPKGQTASSMASYEIKSPITGKHANGSTEDYPEDKATPPAPISTGPTGLNSNNSSITVA